MVRRRQEVDPKVSKLPEQKFNLIALAIKCRGCESINFNHVRHFQPQLLLSQVAVAPFRFDAFIRSG